MAIPVKNKNDSELIVSTDTFEKFFFGGLTTQGEDFLHSLDTDKWYIFDTSLNYYTEIDVTLQELANSNQNYNINIFQSQVGGLLDSTATYYGYDSIDNAISYYDSLDSTKREEARSFSSWRDSVEFLADVNIFSYTADGVTLPDLAGFTGQTGYAEFSVVPIPTTFFGNEDAGYHITDLENRIFTAWINVDHNSSSNYGYGVQIPFPTGNITKIYSLGAMVDQGGLTSEWFSEDYTLKIKMSGTANDYGVFTEFDYKINSLSNNSNYQGLVLRFNILGEY